MGDIQKIASEGDILERAHFDAAMKKMASVSEGELQYYLSFDTNGQTANFKREYALAKAEMDRRSFSQQKRLATISTIAGFVGVVVGAFLQAFFAWLYL